MFGGEGRRGALAQYCVAVQDGDKDLVTYVMHKKLGLLSGRVLTCSVDGAPAQAAWTVFIRTLVLNAELPLASRLHAIEAYNRGYYDLLVATDEK